MDIQILPITVMAASAVSLAVSAWMFEITPLVRKLAIALLVVNAATLTICFIVQVGLFSSVPAFLLPMSCVVMSVVSLFAVYIPCKFPPARRH